MLSKEEIIDILNNNKENIENGNWEAVYKNINWWERRFFSDFLIENDVDPSTLFKTCVPDYAFAYCECSSLQSITLPNSLKKIGMFAFRHCINLTEIKYDGTQQEWKKVKKGENPFKDCPAENKITFLR